MWDGLVDLVFFFFLYSPFLAFGFGTFLVGGPVGGFFFNQLFSSQLRREIH